MEIEGKLVDLHQWSVYAASITIEDGCIRQISKLQHTSGPYIIPGFIDAHVHIESSMLVPAEFARLAVTHGTVATVSDPHEIGNVLGVDGVEYMIQNSKQVNFKCFFGAPSCVPATGHETAGAVIDGDDLNYLLSKPEIKYLAEMMNWPGVINQDPVVLEKIAIARSLHKPVDGHAPGLRGYNAKKYIKAGISTDHECYGLEEALEKLSLGMNIIIREGSAARNFDALIPLLPEYSDKVMFCSDDLHPDRLVRGHINLLVERAVAYGINPLTVLQVACKNPVDHYGLEVGTLQQGHPADFAMVEDLEKFRVQKVYINGQKVMEHGRSFIPRISSAVVNNFNAAVIGPTDLAVKPSGKYIRTIVAQDGQLITGQQKSRVKIVNGQAVSDPLSDVLKMVVINRYSKASPSIAFVKNFGLKKGAIASSVAHDSHNIIAVGADDKSICEVVNELIRHRGGVAATLDGEIAVLPLPIAGLMSNEDGYQVAKNYTAIDAMAKSMGSTLEAPFMTLSFMALLVIPRLKLSDRGLFDGQRFEFVSLFED